MLQNSCLVVSSQCGSQYVQERSTTEMEGFLARVTLADDVQVEYDFAFFTYNIAIHRFGHTPAPSYFSAPSWLMNLRLELVAAAFRTD